MPSSTYLLLASCLAVRLAPESMIPLSLADTGGLTADGLLPLTGFPAWMWGSDILNGQLWGGTEIAELFFITLADAAKIIFFN